MIAFTRFHSRPIIERPIVATPLAGVSPKDAPLRKKDIFEIWRADRAPYIATVSAAYPLDLMRKFEEAKQFQCPKMFLASSPCPTGWHFDPAKDAALFETRSR